MALSAVAVDNDIVGKDSDGELIWADGELRTNCCCAAAAARREAVAVCASAFDLGDVEKKLANFFTRGEEALRCNSIFSLNMVELVAVDGVLLAKGFMRGTIGHD